MGDDAEGSRHLALLYRDLDEYLTYVGNFVHSGLKAGDRVFVAVPTDHLKAIREHLGLDADRVELVDMTAAGRNPGRIMTCLTDFAGAACAEGGRAWLVGEPIWTTRSVSEIREATRHEALINLAFAGVAATVLCPYDVAGLDAATLADAERTHPVLATGGTEWSSATYADPVVVATGCDLSDAVPVVAEVIHFGPGEIVNVRRRAQSFGHEAGLSEVRAVDLKLAVGEAVANSIRYGGGAGTLALWRDADEVVAEIQDRGRVGDPLAGRRRPPQDALGGRGLWMIHHLCDLVELGPGRLRLHMSREA